MELQSNQNDQSTPANEGRKVVTSGEELFIKRKELYQR